MKKCGWRPDEDAIITAQVARGVNWAQIAELLSGRNRKQVRERWHNHLDPSLKKAPWTSEEDARLQALQGSLGNKWAQISAVLEGRCVLAGGVSNAC